MADLSQKSEPELFLDLLLHGLRVKDELLNAVAGDILVRQGNRPAPRLVLEAGRERNTPAHRVRVLAVLKRIAAVAGLEVTQLMGLNGLLFAKNKTVREAACRFFEREGAPGNRARAEAAGPRDLV